MSRRALLAALLLLAPPALHAQGEPRDTLGLRPAFRLIDRYAAQQLAQENTPGLALALVDRRGLITVRSYGYADLERRLPVTPQTRFQIGSISKSFTAIALLQLADEGRFDPNRPVRNTLSWFTPRSEWRPVTAHDLLTHTSGLPADRDDVPSSKAQAYMARERTLGSAPGSHWAYSNIGYQVLGVLLERLEHERYPAIIQRRLLGPLGMSATLPEFTHEDRLAMAKGYVSLFDDRPSRREDPLVEAPWIEYGSGDGSLVSTPADLGRYLTMLLNRGAGPSGRLLSERGYAALMQPWAPIGEEGERYGYGMFLGTLDGRPIFWHSGGMLGYSSYLVGEPELGVGAIAFVNGPGDPGDVARFALRALAAAMRGDSMPAMPPPADPLRVDSTAQYAGLYHDLAGDTLRFEASGDSLLLVEPHRRTALESRGDDSFLGPAPRFARFPLRFARDSGRVIGVAYGGDWYVGEHYRGPLRYPVPAAWNSYVGHYRIMQPWQPNFRVILRRGRLYLVGPEGGEEPLTPIGNGEFRVGDVRSAERLVFSDVAEGQALVATLSGMRYYRAFTP